MNNEAFYPIGKNVMKRNKAGLKIISIFTLIAFVAAPVTWAAPASQSSIPQNQSINLLSEKLIIPDSLGTIQEQNLGAPGKPQIIFIQDAHAVIDAQQNISALIEYFQSKYGIRLVALEGGQGKIDTTLLKAFPNRDITGKVMQGYLERAEINGAVLASALNPNDAVYYGIEDWPLYEMNYVAYLRAMKRKDEIFKELDRLRQKLDAQRREVYSPEMNLYHEKVQAFREEKGNLMDLLAYIRNSAEGAWQKDIRGGRYPHLKVLLDSLGNDAQFASGEASVQVNDLAKKIKKQFARRMTKAESMEFNGVSQDFATGRMDAAAFLKYLIAFAEKRGKSLELSPLLRQMLGYADTLATIKGTKLFAELEDVLNDVEEGLITKKEEREISERYKKIMILKNLAALELTREELAQFSKTPEVFQELIQDRGLLLPAMDFYRFALQRDSALHANLEKLMRDQQAQAAVVLAGGFHSEGFTASLKERGYSYVMITPKIKSLAGHERYEKVMAGELSYKEYLKTTVYDAFARHATLKLVSEMNAPDFKKTLKLWRDETIRRLAAEGRVGAAGRYTRYLDSLIRLYAEKFGPEGLNLESKEAMIKAVEWKLAEYRDNSLEQLWKLFEIKLSGLAQGVQALLDKNDVSREKLAALIREEGLKPSTLAASLGEVIPGMSPGILEQVVLGQLDISALDALKIPVSMSDIRDALTEKQSLAGSSDLTALPEIGRGAEVLSRIAQEGLPSNPVSKQIAANVVEEVIGAIRPKALERAAAKVDSEIAAALKEKLDAATKAASLGEGQAEPMNPEWRSARVAALLDSIRLEELITDENIRELSDPATEAAARERMLAVMLEKADPVIDEIRNIYNEVVSASLKRAERYPDQARRDQWNLTGILARNEVNEKFVQPFIRKMEVLLEAKGASHPFFDEILQSMRRTDGVAFVSYTMGAPDLPLDLSLADPQILNDQILAPLTFGRWDDSGMMRDHENVFGTAGVDRLYAQILSWSAAAVGSRLAVVHRALPAIAAVNERGRLEMARYLLLSWGGNLFGQYGIPDRETVDFAKTFTDEDLTRLVELEESGNPSYPAGFSGWLKGIRDNHQQYWFHPQFEADTQKPVVDKVQSARTGMRQTLLTYLDTPGFQSLAVATLIRLADNPYAVDKNEILPRALALLTSPGVDAAVKTATAVYLAMSMTKSLSPDIPKFLVEHFEEFPDFVRDEISRHAGEAFRNLVYQNNFEIDLDFARKIAVVFNHQDSRQVKLSALDIMDTAGFMQMLEEKVYFRFNGESADWAFQFAKSPLFMRLITSFHDADYRPENKHLPRWGALLSREHAENLEDVIKTLSGYARSQGYGLSWGYFEGASGELENVAISGVPVSKILESIPADREALQPGSEFAVVLDARLGLLPGAAADYAAFAAELARFRDVMGASADGFLHASFEPLVGQLKARNPQLTIKGVADYLAAVNHIEEALLVPQPQASVNDELTEDDIMIITEYLFTNARTAANLTKLFDDYFNSEASGPKRKLDYHFFVTFMKNLVNADDTLVTPEADIFFKLFTSKKLHGFYETKKIVRRNANMLDAARNAQAVQFFRDALRLLNRPRTDYLGSPWRLETVSKNKLDDKVDVEGQRQELSRVLSKEFIGILELMIDLNAVQGAAAEGETGNLLELRDGVLSAIERAAAADERTAKRRYGEFHAAERTFRDTFAEQKANVLFQLFRGLLPISSDQARQDLADLKAYTESAPRNQNGESVIDSMVQFVQSNRTRPEVAAEAYRIMMAEARGEFMDYRYKSPDYARMFAEWETSRKPEQDTDALKQEREAEISRIQSNWQANQYYTAADEAGKKVHLGFTDNFATLLNLGNPDYFGSCQATYKADYNRGVAGMLANGWNKALVIYDDNGRFLARRIVRLRLTDKGEFVLIREQTYGFNSYEKIFEEMLAKLAHDMGIRYEPDSGGTAESITLRLWKGNAENEYSDKYGKQFLGENVGLIRMKDGEEFNPYLNIPLAVSTAAEMGPAYKMESEEDFKLIANREQTGTLIAAGFVAIASSSLAGVATAASLGAGKTEAKKRELKRVQTQEPAPELTIADIQAKAREARKSVGSWLKFGAITAVGLIVAPGAMKLMLVVFLVYMPLHELAHYAVAKYFFMKNYPAGARTDDVKADAPVFEPIVRWAFGMFPHPAVIYEEKRYTSFQNALIIIMAPISELLLGAAAYAAISVFGTEGTLLDLVQVVAVAGLAAVPIRLFAEFFSKHSDVRKFIANLRNPHGLADTRTSDIETAFVGKTVRLDMKHPEPGMGEPLTDKEKITERPSGQSLGVEPEHLEIMELLPRSNTWRLRDIRPGGVDRYLKLDPMGREEELGFRYAKLLGANTPQWQRFKVSELDQLKFGDQAQSRWGGEWAEAVQEIKAHAAETGEENVVLAQDMAAMTGADLAVPDSSGFEEMLVFLAFTDARDVGWNANLGRREIDGQRRFLLFDMTSAAFKGTPLNDSFTYNDEMIGRMYEELDAARVKAAIERAQAMSPDDLINQALEAGYAAQEIHREGFADRQKNLGRIVANALMASVKSPLIATGLPLFADSYINYSHVNYLLDTPEYASDFWKDVMNDLFDAGAPVFTALLDKSDDEIFAFARDQNPYLYLTLDAVERTVQVMLDSIPAYGKSALPGFKKEELAGFARADELGKEILRKVNHARDVVSRLRLAESRLYQKTRLIAESISPGGASLGTEEAGVDQTRLVNVSLPGARDFLISAVAEPKVTEAFGSVSTPVTRLTAQDFKLPEAYPDEALSAIKSIEAKSWHLKQFIRIHNEVLSELTAVATWQPETADRFFERFESLVSSFISFMGRESAHADEADDKLRYFRELYADAKQPDALRLNSFFHQMMGLWGISDPQGVQHADTFNKFINWMHTAVNDSVFEVSRDFAFPVLDLNHYQSKQLSPAAQVINASIRTDAARHVGTKKGIFDTAILLDGNSVWIQYGMGVHRMQMYGDFVPPVLGGRVEIIYVEGGSKGGNRLRMKLLKKAFEKMGFSAQELGSGFAPDRLRIVYSKAEGAASVSDLVNKMNAALEVLSDTRDVDLGYRDLSEGYSNPQWDRDYGDVRRQLGIGPDSHKALETIIEEISSRVAKHEGNYPLLPPTAHVGPITNRISEDDTEPWASLVTTGKKEDGSPDFWNGEGPYPIADPTRKNDDDLLRLYEILSSSLKELRLPAMPPFSARAFNQSFIDRHYNDVVQRALEANKTTYQAQADFNLFIDRWSVEQNRFSMIAMKDIIRQIPADYKYLGRIGEGRLFKAEVTLLDKRLTIYAYKSVSGEDILAGMILVNGSAESYDEVNRVLVQNNIPANYPPLSPADRDMAIQKTEILMRTPPDAPLYVGEMVQGISLLPGKATGYVTFDEASPDLGGKILFASDMTDENVRLLKHLRGMVTKSGNSLDHLNMRAKPNGKPRVSLPEAEFGEDERGPFMKTGAQMRRVNVQYIGYPIRMIEQVSEEEAMSSEIREGDLLTISGSTGLAYWVSGNPSILESFKLMNAIEQAETPEALAASLRELAEFTKRAIRDLETDTLKFILRNVILGGGFSPQVQKAVLDNLMQGRPARYFQKLFLMLQLRKPNHEIGSYLRSIFSSARSDFNSVFKQTVSDISTASRIDHVYYQLSRFHRKAEAFRMTQNILSGVLPDGKTIDPEELYAQVRKLALDRLKFFHGEFTARLREFVAGRDMSAVTTKDILIVRRFSDRLREFQRMGFAFDAADAPAVQAIEDLRARLESERTREIESKKEAISRDLADLGADENGLVGNKAANLGWLFNFLRWYNAERSETVQFAPGFALSTHAYNLFLDQEVSPSRPLRQAIGDVLALDISDKEKARQIAGLIEGAELPDAIVQVINQFCSQNVWAERSTTLIEDTPASSAAGLFVSLLGLDHPEKVISALKKTWASLFSEAALAYRRDAFPDAGVSGDEVQGSLIQELIEADASGVISSADLSGDRNTIAINAGYGLGTSIVDTKQDADYITVDKLTREVRVVRGSKKSKTIWDKETRTIKTVPTSQQEQEQDAISQVMIDRITRLTLALEEWFGYVVDVEFAVKDNQLYILQVRPVPGFRVEPEEKKTLDTVFQLIQKPAGTAEAQSLGAYEDAVKRELENKFLNVEKIGSGDQAIVFKAKNNAGMDVAIKVEQDDVEYPFPSESEIRRIIYALGDGHPNVERIIDAGQIEIESKSRTYVVAEYIDGVTLGTYLGQRELPLDFTEIVDFMDGIMEGYQFLNRTRVRSPDARLDNVMINQSGVPVVIDFLSSVFPTHMEFLQAETLVQLLTGIRPFSMHSLLREQGFHRDLEVVKAKMRERYRDEAVVDGVARIFMDYFNLYQSGKTPDYVYGRVQLLRQAVEGQSLGAAVPFNELIAALRNNIGRTDSTFLNTMFQRLKAGDTPIQPGDPVGKLSTVDTLLPSFKDKHFPDPHEAVREIITNGYDAMKGIPEPSQRNVNVALGTEGEFGTMEVSDSGPGMRAETILTKFLPPFQGDKKSERLDSLKEILDREDLSGTQKIESLRAQVSQDIAGFSAFEQAIYSDLKRKLQDYAEKLETSAEEAGSEEELLGNMRDILYSTGQFGIGFYSLLYFVRQEGDEVNVVTRFGIGPDQEAYRVTFLIEEGKLKIRFERLAPSAAQPGTAVRLKSRSFDKDSARKVIDDFLSFDNNAKINVEVDAAATVTVNREAFDRERFEHFEDAANGVEIYATKDVRRNKDEPKTKVSINVHGVTIFTQELEGFGMPSQVVLNFPPNIRVPISRNRILADPLFIAKALAMIALMEKEKRLDLLSAFYPVADKLQYKRVQDSGAVKRRLREAAQEARQWNDALIPNTEKFTKLSPKEQMFLVDPGLIADSTNDYSGAFERVMEGDQPAILGTKKVMMAEFVDDTKFVASADTVYVNRRFMPVIDIHRALFNPLLGLENEPKFSYYEPVPAAAEAQQPGPSAAAEPAELSPSETAELEARAEEILSLITRPEVRQFVEPILRYAKENNRLQEILWDSAHFAEFAARLVDSGMYQPSHDDLTEEQTLDQWMGVLAHLSKQIRNLNGRPFWDAVFEERNFASLRLLAEAVPNYRRYVFDRLFVSLRNAIPDKDSRDVEIVNPDQIHTWVTRSAGLSESLEHISYYLDEYFLAAAITNLDDTRFAAFQRGLVPLGGMMEELGEWDKRKALAAFLELNRYWMNEGYFAWPLAVFLNGDMETVERYSRLVEETVPFIQAQAGSTPEHSDEGPSLVQKGDFAAFFAGILNSEVGERQDIINLVFRANPDQSFLYDQYTGLNILKTYLFYLSASAAARGEQNVPDWRAQYDLLNSHPAARNVRGLLAADLPLGDKLTFLKSILDMVSEGVNFTYEREWQVRAFFDYSLLKDMPVREWGYFVQLLDHFDSAAGKKFIDRKHRLKNPQAGPPTAEQYRVYREEISRKLIRIYKIASVSGEYDKLLESADQQGYSFDNWEISRFDARLAPYVSYLLANEDATDLKDEIKLDAQKTRRFRLVDLYDTWSDVPDAKVEAEADVLARVNAAVGFSKQADAGRQARREFLSADFRSVSRQNMDLHVAAREMVQNVLDETPPGTRGKLTVNTHRKDVDGRRLTVLDVQDEIGMDAERIFNKLLMPFSTTKLDPSKGYLGEQGQGFFTLLANSEYVVIESVRNGKGRKLKITPIRKFGDVIDYMVEDEQIDPKPAKKMKNGTRIQAFVNMGMPELESEMVKTVVKKYTGLVNPDRMEIVVNAEWVNDNKKNLLTTRESPRGTMEFYSTPGTTDLGLGGLQFKPMDDGFMALIPAALRKPLTDAGFSVNLPAVHPSDPAQRIRRIQGGTDIAERDAVYGDIALSVATGSLEAAVAMFSRGEIRDFDLFGYDFFGGKKAEITVDPAIVADARQLRENPADADMARIAETYLQDTPDSRNRLGRLLLAYPADFLPEVGGNKISLMDFFNLYRQNPDDFPDLQNLPETIRKALQHVDETIEHEDRQKASLEGMGISPEAQGTHFNVPELLDAQAGAYRLFLKMSDYLAALAIRKVSDLVTPEDVGQTFYDRLGDLSQNPPVSLFYAETDGLSMAHAYQQTNAYAWNILDAESKVKALAEYIKAGPDGQGAFLKEMFEPMIETLTHELTHLLEGSQEGTHDKLFYDRQKFLLSALISFEEESAGVIADFVARLPFTESQSAGFMPVVELMQGLFPSGAEVVPMAGTPVQGETKGETVSAESLGSAAVLAAKSPLTVLTGFANAEDLAKDLEERIVRGEITDKQTLEQYLNRVAKSKLREYRKMLEDESAQVISRLETAENFFDALFDLEAQLEGVARQVRAFGIPVTAEELASALRAAVFDPAGEDAVKFSVQAENTVTDEQLQLFDLKMSKAHQMMAQKSLESGQKFSLALQHAGKDMPSELEALKNYRQMIKLLIILHEKRDPLNRSDFSALGVTTLPVLLDTASSAKLERVIRQTMRQMDTAKVPPLFIFAKKMGLNADLSQLLLSILAQIDQVPDRMKKQAIDAVLLVIFSLAMAGEDERAEVLSGSKPAFEKLLADYDVNFLKDAFNIDSGGGMSLSIASFISSIIEAAQEQAATEKAA